MEMKFFFTTSLTNTYNSSHKVQLCLKTSDNQTQNKSKPLANCTYKLHGWTHPHIHVSMHGHKQTHPWTQNIDGKQTQKNRYTDRHAVACTAHTRAYTETTHPSLQITVNTCRSVLFLPRKITSPKEGYSTFTIQSFLCKSSQPTMLYLPFGSDRKDEQSRVCTLQA